MSIYVLSARSFVLSLYGIKATNYSSLDQLQYYLASTTDKPASHLTPTEDAFQQGVLKAKTKLMYGMFHIGD
jgi:hypothetical protein